MISRNFSESGKKLCNYRAIHKRNVLIDFCLHVGSHFMNQNCGFRGTCSKKQSHRIRPIQNEWRPKLEIGLGIPNNFCLPGFSKLPQPLHRKVCPKQYSMYFLKERQGPISHSQAGAPGVLLTFFLVRHPSLMYKY